MDGAWPDFHPGSATESVGLPRIAISAICSTRWNRKAGLSPLVLGIPGQPGHELQCWEPIPSSVSNAIGMNWQEADRLVN